MEVTTLVRDEFSQRAFALSVAGSVHPGGHPPIYLTAACAYISFVSPHHDPILLFESVARVIDKLLASPSNATEKGTNQELRESFFLKRRTVGWEFTAGSRVGALRLERSVGARPSTCAGVLRAFFNLALLSPLLLHTRCCFPSSRTRDFPFSLLTGGVFGERMIRHRCRDSSIKLT